MKNAILEILKNDPSLQKQENHPLREAIFREFKDSLGLAQIG